MSVEIEISTETAEGRVDKLGESILGLADKAKTAGDGVRKNLDFSSDAITQIKELGKSLDGLNSLLKGFGGNLRDLGNVTRTVAQQQGSLRENVAKSSAAIITQSRAIKDNTSSNSENTKSMVEGRKAAVALANARGQLSKIMRDIQTSAQREAEMQKTLNILMKDGKLSANDMARAMAVYSKSFASAGTDSEKMLASLRQQNAEFNKSPAQLAKMTAGYNLLSEAQKKSLTYNLQIAQDIQTISGLMTRALSPLESYYQQTDALNNLRGRLNPQTKQLYITEQQYKVALDNARSALVKATDAEAKRSQVRARSATADEEAAAGLRQYLQQVQASLSVNKASEVELLKLRAGWDQLSASEQKAAQQTVQLAADMKLVGSSITAQLAPIDQLKAKLASLSNLKAGGVINQGQYATGVAAARTEYDALSKSAARAAAGLKVATNGFSVANQGAAALRAGLYGTGVAFGGFAASTVVAAAGAYGITKALKETVVVGAEFEKALRSATSVFAEIPQTPAGLQKYIDAFLKLSQTSKYSAAEVAEAFKSLGQAGKSAEESLQMLPTVLNFATVGSLSTEEAANKLVNTLAAFEKPTNAAAEVADKLTAASLASTTTISELTQSLGQAGATAHSAGVGLEETIAAVALLRQIGISASKAGTDLRNIIQDLASQTPKAKAAMNAYGVDLKKVWSGPGGTLNLIQAFKELKKAMDGMTPKQRTDFAETLFNKRTAGALSTFVKQIGDAKIGIQHYVDQVENSSGATQRIADIINNNAVTAFAQLKNSVASVAIQAFTEYSGELTLKIRELTSYIIQNGPALSSSLAGLMTTILKIGEFLVTYLPTIVKWGAAFVTWKVATTTVRELAYGLGLVQAAISGIAAEKIATNLSQELGIVASASGTATKGLAGTALTLGRFAPLLAAAGIASYELTRYLLDLSDSAEKADEEFANFLSHTHQLQEVGKTISSMNSQEAQAYFKQLVNSSADLASQLKAANEQVEKLAAEKDKVSAGWSGLPNEVAGNIQEITIAWNEARGKAEALGKEIQKNFSLAATAIGQVIGQSAAATTAIDGLSTSMNILSVFTSAFTAAAPGFSKTLSTIKDTVNAARGQADAIQATIKAAKDQAAAEAGRAEALANSKARSHELASELKSITQAYGKQSGSVDDLNRQLSQNNAIRAAISAKNPAVIKEMEKLGLTAEQARKELDWSDESKTIDAVSDMLGALDPRYKDLAKSMKDVNKGQLDGAKAFELVTKWLEESNYPLALKNKLLAELKPLLHDIDDGAVQSAQKLSQLSVSTQQMVAQFTNIDPVKGELQSLGIAYDKLDSSGKQTAETFAQQRVVIKALGSDFLSTLSPMQQYLAISNALDKSAQALGLSETQLAAAHRKLWESTPLGGLEKQNKLLEAQIGFASQGGKNWEAYNAAVQAVNGDLTQLTPQIVAAAEAQAKLNEELAQIHEVQDAFKGFASDLSKVFADFVTGGIKNFKDFKSQIKSTFKSLLSDLLSMALRNALFSFLGFGSGTGNTGFWAGVNSLIGGGGGGGASVGGYSGGINVGGQTFGIGDLVGLASANYTGGTYQGGGGGYAGGLTGGASGGGSPWLNLITQGGSAYNMYANGGISGMWGRAVTGYNNFMYGGQNGYYGSNVMGSWIQGENGLNTWTPSGFGTAVGIAGGLYAGYGRYQNRYNTATGLVGGAAYGIGTYAAGAGLASAAAGGGFAAGVGGGMSAVGMVPVIGWIALAAMLVDMLSGGKLFGTKGKVIGGASQLDIGGQGANLTQWYTTKGQKPLFGGAYYDEHQTQVDPEAQKAADEFYAAIKKGRDQFAKVFGVEMGDIVGGTFVQSFDKHGNATTSTTTINGKEYKDETQEQFAERLGAENLIAVLNKVGVDITSYTNGFIDDADKYSEAVNDAAQAMTAAFMDIKGNVGLFQGDDALQKTFDTIVKLKNADESLADAYTRIIGSVNLVNETLGPMGANLNKTREEYVEWSADLVNSLGGLQAAQQIMQDFSDTFGIAFNTGQYAMEQAETRLKGLLSSIGLSVNTSADEFAEAFQKMLPNMTSAEAADWLRVAEAFSQIKKLKDALSDFMFGIDEQMAQFEGRTYTHQMEAVNRQMEANIRQARALGASEDQLNRIRKLATYQIAQLMGQLKAELTDLVKQFHGDKGLQQAQQAAHDAQMDNIKSEQQAEQDKYEAAQDAIKQIKDLLNQLNIGDLSPKGVQGRMESAQATFQQTLQAALGGDPEAMQNLAGAAQDYLELAQQYFGSGVNYDQIFEQVTQALRDAQTAFEQIEKPPENIGSGGGGSGGAQTTQLTEAERFQLALQIAQDIGQLHLATGADVLDLMKAYGVTIGELADSLGVDINHLNDDTFANLQIMAQALGVSIPDLLTMLGAKGDAIAAYFGVKADDIIAGNIDALNTMATTLGVNVLEALQIANIPITDLLSGMGIDISTLTADTPAQLAAVAASLGVSVIDLMGAAGITMTDLVTAWNNGVAITSLDPASMLLLGNMARALGIDIVTLLTNMGFDTHTMAGGIADALQSGFDAIPDLPIDIKDQLKEYLEAIRNSGDNEELNTNTTNLSTYVDSLPEDVKASLGPVLTDVGIAVTGPGDTTLATVNNTLGDGNREMQTVADNTGEDGPIVRELKNLVRLGGGTEAASASGEATTVQFDPEAMQAMTQGFFTETFDMSDLYGEGSVDTSEYAEEEQNRNASTATATAESAATTAKASQAAAAEMNRMCDEIAAMHVTLARQTAKLSGMLEQQTQEAAKHRREQRLNKK